LARRSEIAAESLEHKAWIAEIPGGRLIVTDDSGHNVPMEQPDLVVETVRQVVELAGSRPN
jgi:pimeloyl-ACP methyl ester carboxylesterase